MSYVHSSVNRIALWPFVLQYLEAEKNCSTMFTINFIAQCFLSSTEITQSSVERT